MQFVHVFDRNNGSGWFHSGRLVVFVHLDNNRSCNYIIISGAGRMLFIGIHDALQTKVKYYYELMSNFHNLKGEVCLRFFESRESRK